MGSTSRAGEWHDGSRHGRGVQDACWANMGKPLSARAEDEGVGHTHTHITNEQSLPKNVSTTYGWTLAHHTMNSTGVSSFRKYGGQFVYSISGEVLGSEPGGSFDTRRVSRRV